MTLEKMKVGEEAIVTGYAVTEVGYRAKLLALGFTRGAKIRFVGVAPMGDPVRLQVRGFEVSLRRAEAAALLLDAVGGGCASACGGCLRGCGRNKETH